MSPEGLLSLTFVGLILGGTLLLRLPAAHGRGPVSTLDALFTSTSAVCVTGLTTVDTGTNFSRFGHATIVTLIQFGGLGIMTFAALAAQLFGGRLSFRSQAALSDAFYQRDAAVRFRTDVYRIIGMTLLIEIVGAGILYSHLAMQPDRHPPLFSAVFHAVSAFCNAGFSLYPRNLMDYHLVPSFMATISTLIVLGGLGHSVLLEIARRWWNAIRRRPNSFVGLALNSRVVVWTSTALIFGGAVALLIFGLTPSEVTWPQRLSGAIFQSVTARTAGFNSIDIGALPTASILVLIGLMFIGGSPGSCAGGIKTTSFITWLLQIKGRLAGKPDITLFGRRIPEDVVSRALIVIGLSVLWNLAGCLVLSFTELPRPGIDFEDLLFEQISAFGTVGLSTGLTPTLSAAGKIWIILSMFVGRVGPLTAALLVLPPRAAAIRYPEERLMIG